jgi:hypothetical protein
MDASVRDLYLTQFLSCDLVRLRFLRSCYLSLVRRLEAVPGGCVEGDPMEAYEVEVLFGVVVGFRDVLRVLDDAIAKKRG